MLRPRVMPCLLLRRGALVKTIRFERPSYVGDPVNAVHIFNEKEVDELILLDISATPDGREPPYATIRELTAEAFMPIAYGGGIRSLDDAARVLGLGIEKVVVNTALVDDPSLVTAIAREFGSQAVVVSIDAKGNGRGYETYVAGGTRATGLAPDALARRAEELGAGEVMITAMDRDGTMSGYDIDLTRSVSSAVSIPVIASGGAGKLEDFRRAVHDGAASACAAGAMVVYYGRNRAVLINFPARSDLDPLFDRR